MKDNRLDEVVSVAKIYQQDLSLITRENSKSKELLLLDIYNKMDSIDNVPPPLIENFRVFILKMKLAMLSNCGFVSYDLEQNEKLERLLQRLNEIRFNLN